MANQVETNTWPAGVYQVASTDPVLGGPEGPVNMMGAGLASRSLYQRLRNITPWNFDLATSVGYPAGACVLYGGVTWKAKVDNDVPPGTDPLKWERWAFTESELAEMLAASSLTVDSPQFLTVAQREQAQENLALPIEYFLATGGSSVAVPNTNAVTQLSLSGGTYDVQGSIARAGNVVQIARPGIYAVSCSVFALKTSTGVISSTVQVRINGVLHPLLKVSVQDQGTTSTGLGYHLNLSGYVRLATGDQVEFTQKAESSAITVNVSGAGLTRVSR